MEIFAEFLLHNLERFALNMVITWVLNRWFALIELANHNCISEHEYYVKHSLIEIRQLEHKNQRFLTLKLSQESRINVLRTNVVGLARDNRVRSDRQNHMAEVDHVLLLKSWKQNKIHSNILVLELGLPIYIIGRAGQQVLDADSTEPESVFAIEQDFCEVEGAIGQSCRVDLAEDDWSNGSSSGKKRTVSPRWVGRWKTRWFARWRSLRDANSAMRLSTSSLGCGTGWTKKQYQMNSKNAQRTYMSMKVSEEGWKL